MTKGLRSLAMTRIPQRSTLNLVPGTITTIAGTGEPGCSGDGGPALKACLNEPKSVTIAGCALYIADSENHRIRKVDLTTGIITTVVGAEGPITPTSILPPQGGGHISFPPPAEGEGQGGGKEADPLADPVKVKDDEVVQLADQSGTVRFLVGSAEKGRFKGDGGPAVAATLNFPSAAVADSKGNLYIADTFNHRVRRVDAATGTIWTLAGTARAPFAGAGGPATKGMPNEPVALALDEQRDLLYIADLANYRVRVVDLDTGRITTYAGNGEREYDGDGHKAVHAALSGPSGLALDAEGILYIADTFSGRIRKIDLARRTISTVAGDGTEYRYQGMPNEFSTSLARPAGIALAAGGTLYITDSDNHLVRKWNPKSKIITSLAGNGTAQFSGDGGPAPTGSLKDPVRLAVEQARTPY